MFKIEYDYFCKLYLQFNRKQWTNFNNFSLPTLTKDQILKLKNINNKISLKEIKEIYLPLSLLINNYINFNYHNQIGFKNFLSVKNKFIVPYIIGITGSVAAGKTTTARILQILLSNIFKYYNIDLITTDSFLYPNKILKKRNIMHRKGFPESYNTHNLFNKILKIKSKIKRITIPIYSHLKRNIIDNKKQIIFKPDILILEGLNLLQKKINDYKNLQNYKSILDFIDFSIYIDAPEKLLKHWYIKRSIKLHQLLYNNNIFHHSLFISKDRLFFIFNKLWNEVNKLNLYQNILPTRKTANLILCKSKNHNIRKVFLHKNLNFK